MRARVSAFFQRPGWVVAGVLAITFVVWTVCLYSIASQIGHPFPGFFYAADRIVTATTPRDFTGWQAGLRPWDRIVAVNGQHWSEMRRLVQEAGIGGTLVYTVERGSQTLQIPVRTMEFTAGIIARFVPGYLLWGLFALAVGIFVYLRNPAGPLNRYLLVYLLVWACTNIVGWEYHLSQQKLAAYPSQPLLSLASVAGWAFFWTFPADRDRRQFLARVPLIRAFVALGVAWAIYSVLLLFLASRLDQPWWWRLETVSASWGSFLLFACGSLYNKTYSLLQIALKKGASPLIRQQAAVLLLGISLGLGGFVVFYWGPGLIHVVPPANIQWGAAFLTFYPLSIGYAILRYQLFDIRVVIRKGLVYSLLTASLTAVFLILSLVTGYSFQALAGRQSYLVALLPALAIAFLFQPARTRIQTFVDRAFFHREYEARQTLTAFSGELSTLRARSEVVRLVLDTVTGTLGAAGATLWLLEGEGEYRPAGSGLQGALPANGGLATWLAQRRRPLLLAPDDRTPEAEELRHAGATLAVPLLAGERLLGLLTLQEKRSGDLYTQEDLELLTTLAHGAALALENARLHEERLAILHQQLAQVTAAQEEERRRIARELHDGVGPALASLNVRLRTVRKLLEQEDHRAAEEIEELADLAQANTRDIRRLIHDLRPAVLDELGLVPALREYLERTGREQGLAVELAGVEDRRLPAPVETALYRIAQEALNNVVRHAQARRVQVSLALDGARVILHIADDGRGFDPQARRSGSHLGLWGMRERVEQLGGSFVVRSAPGEGTDLTVAIPVEAQEGEG